MTKHYHLCGIGGTAMSAVALMLKKKKYRVTGSDANIYPPVSDLLTRHDIQYSDGYAEDYLAALNPDVTVIGNALSRGNSEVEYILENKLTYSSIGETLKEEFIRGNTSIVMTGTHGKTTCASLMAHIFDTAGLRPGFLIGGIPGNFDVSGRPCEKSNGYFIIEGDEYDNAFYDKRSKFFHYMPHYLLINNIEFDHGDIFRDIDDIKQSFRYLQRLVPRNGVIVANGDDANVVDVINHDYCRVITFGHKSSNQAVISDVIPTRHAPGMKFALSFENEVTYWEIPMFGGFNVSNTVGCLLFALLSDIPHDLIRDALLSYKRPKKRLEEKTANISVRVFDDFAHHPTAIKEAVNAIKTAFPNNRIIAVYEPRSNTSVRKFHQEKMTSALKDADIVFIYKLHRGDSVDKNDRLDIPQIISELNHAGTIAKYTENIEELRSELISTAKKDDVFVIMSQTNFGNLATDLSIDFDRRFSSAGEL